MSDKKITNREIFSYSLLALPLSFMTLPVYIYLPQFYANNYVISLQTIGIILLLCRVFDALQDPLLGLLSDKFSHLKKRIILFSAPLLGFSFLLLFSPASSNITLWLFVSLILTYTFFSIIQINYQSFALNLSSDYNLKTKIVSMRESFGVVGIIIASIAPAILFNYFSPQKSFLILAIFLLVIISVFALIFYFKTPTPANAENTTKFNLNFLKISQLKHFLILFLINSFALSIPAVLILFFIEKVVQAPKFNGLFMACYFFGLLAGIPLWAKIAALLNDKIKAWLIAMALVIVIFFSCYFVGQGDILFYALICVFSGLCFGADYCLSYSILADLIQENKLEKNESTIFGVINFITKFSFSLASGILLYFLGEIQESKFVSEQSFLTFAYVIISCLFKVFAFFCLVIFYQKFSQRLCLKKSS